jgi:zinc transport system ATP-binding protein
MALITCRNTAFAYEGKTVVSGIKLDVHAGDYLYVVGENGSGKTTLIKGMLGLIAPSSGEIRFGDGLRQTEIGYLPQRAALQRDFPATVREVVSSGFAARSLMPTRAQRQTIERNLMLLGIADLGRRSFMSLSGGQQQRALLARALCATDKLILLDEPVSGLDPVATREMYELIARMHSEHRVTVVMISHDIEAALRYGTHVLHLWHEPVFFGTSDEYARSEASRSFMGDGHDV